MVKNILTKKVSPSARICCFKNQKAVKDELIQLILVTNLIEYKINDDNCDLYISLENTSNLCTKDLYYIFKMKDENFDSKLDLSEKEKMEVICYIINLFTKDDYEVKVHESNELNSTLNPEKLLDKWLKERCESSLYGEFSSILFEDFISYCREIGENYHSENSTPNWFGRRMSDKFIKVDKNRRRYYLGICLKNK